MKKETTKSPQSTLWKISGKGLVEFSYLFGTMHLMRESDFILKDKVINALYQCRELVLEIDFNNADEWEQLQNAPLPQGKISDGLSTKGKKELGEILYRDYNLSLEQADHLSPLSLINMMILKAVDSENIKMFESELVNLAHNKHIIISGMESTHSQMQIANTIYSSKELLRQLREGHSYMENFSGMVNAYLEEDIEKLETYINDRRFMKKKDQDIMIFGRNREWSEKMPEMMQVRPVFFAVGAGHLPGNKGIIKLLERKGYQVEPILG